MHLRCGPQCFYDNLVPCLAVYIALQCSVLKVFTVTHAAALPTPEAEELKTYLRQIMFGSLYW